MKRVMVVEDEKDLREILCHNLREPGKIETVPAKDGDSAMKLYARRRPDLIVLDVRLPRMDGLEVLKNIRFSDKDTPIFILSAMASEHDRVLGLRLGADDYIKKPFSMDELRAKIDGRFQRGFRAPGSLPKHTFGTLEVDWERHDVHVGGKRIEVAPKELGILRKLIVMNGKVLSRDNLLDGVWGYERKKNVGDRIVDQHIFRLRKNLGPEGWRISTVSGAGYRFLTK